MTRSKNDLIHLIIVYLILLIVITMLIVTLFLFLNTRKRFLSTVLITDHNGGFFACVNIKFRKIIDFITKVCG